MFGEDNKLLEHLCIHGEVLTQFSNLAHESANDYETCFLLSCLLDNWHNRKSDKIAHPLWVAIFETATTEALTPEHLKKNVALLSLVEKACATLDDEQTDLLVERIEEARKQIIQATKPQAVTS